jgi:CheY-like chemotaxis protein
MANTLCGEEKAMDPQRMRILICDTDPEVLIQAERMLEDAGFDTTTTWNPADLVRLTQIALFDAVVLADHASQMHAEMMLKELRERQHPVRRVFCLLWQRHINERDVERLRSAGAEKVICAKDCVLAMQEVRFSLQSMEIGLPKAASVC